MERIGYRRIFFVRLGCRSSGSRKATVGCIKTRMADGAWEVQNTKIDVARGEGSEALSAIWGNCHGTPLGKSLGSVMACVHLSHLQASLLQTRTPSKSLEVHSSDKNVTKGGVKLRWRWCMWQAH
mmetsp:Transcript_7211/g.16625  ORF Transcript_7211/g.16625 Transcript_7211/m.16625 type:complete len:125 (-) Transcript_7211:505-879(-)